jgi:apolipoprotein N-acyltransferase
VAICYESVYPSVARQFVDNGSELLATITNDAWFGQTSAPWQHFEQGAIRAVEQGRFVVRATNTGISGAIDPYGRVLASTPLFEPAALTVDVRLLTARTIYGRTGDVVVWAALGLSLMPAAWVVTGRRRRLPSGGPPPSPK